MIGCRAVKARMRTPAIVEVEISADRCEGLADGVVGPQIDLLVFDTAPQPLDEDVVPPGALVGTLTIVFAIVNTDRLPRALSNSGGGFFYAVEYFLKADDGTVYAATDPSGIFAGNELHTAMNYHMSKEGTVKFKVPKGNYAVVFGRKYGGKRIAKYDFSCTISVR